MHTACLLLHGFGGTPFEMRPLVPALEVLGFECRLPLLPGHGTSIGDLSKTGYMDWLNCALENYDQLAESHEAVAVVGFSMGGALALHVAAQRKALAVAALAPPIRIYSFRPWHMPDWRLPFMGFARHIKPIFKTEPRSEHARRVAPWEGYEGAMAVKPLHSFKRGLALLRGSLRFVTAPVFLMASRRDLFSPPHGAMEIARRVNSEDVTVRVITIPGTSGQHMLTTHVQCAAATAAETAAFLTRFHAAR